MAERNRRQTSGKQSGSKSPRSLLLSAIIAVAAIVLGFLGISLGDVFPDIYGTESSGSAAASAVSKAGTTASDVSVTGDGSLEVRFIDVGQADCILVQCDGETMLIDAGDQGSYETISGVLDGLGITRLDYVIATHPHADHIGSMAKVIESYEVGTVILPDIPESLTPTTRTFEKMMDAIENEGCTVKQAVPLDTFSVGGAEVTILGPAGEYSDLNNISVVCRMVYGEYSFMFTGDAETTAEADILKLDTTLRSTVLKMGHHGSSTSTSREFFEAVDPLYCVISCGKDNDYGHPHRETLELLDEYQIIPYRTDTMGTVLFRLENGELKVTTEK